MRVYIAGPMTGIEALNFPAFHREAVYLRSQGHEVVNPAEINPDPTAKCVDCIKELVGCDAVAMLPNWDKSKGARLEHYIANALEIKIIYINREVIA